MNLKSLLKNHAEKKAYDKGKSYPEWVTDSNSSKAAYDAIDELFPIKKAYIKSHKNKSDFKVKKHYQIQRSEVAEKIGGGVTVQPLFNLNSYSENLEEYRVRKNKELQQILDNKFTTKSEPPIRDRDKATLVRQLQEANAEIEKLKATLGKAQLELLLSKLPLDVKKRMKI